jgi:DNA-binding NtrC family response regulator
MCADAGILDLNGATLANELCMLLVYDQQESFQALEPILLDWGMPTRRVRSCAAARAALCGANAPPLVLTDTVLPDGIWADVLQVARDAWPSSSIIVVSRIVDIPLYLDVLDSGAYDFVAPPFVPADLAHIVRGAILFSNQGRENFDQGAHRLRGRAGQPHVAGPGRQEVPLGERSFRR